MFWERLLDLLYPPRCVACRRRGSLFCTQCGSECQPLAAAGWLQAPLPALAGVAGLYAFLPPLREAIHGLKYQRLTGLVRPLASMMAAQLLSCGLLPEGLAMAWVPLHRDRARERGFNQAELLARQLAGQLNLPLVPGLTRLRATPPQVGREAEARRENMRGAFRWSGRLAPPARVILLDDVLTTGATLNACAEALHAAGAQEVYGLTLAVAGAVPAQQRCTLAPGE